MSFGGVVGDDGEDVAEDEDGDAVRAGGESGEAVEVVAVVSVMGAGGIEMTVGEVGSGAEPAGGVSAGRCAELISPMPTKKSSAKRDSWSGLVCKY